MGSQFIHEWTEIGMPWMILAKNKFKHLTENSHDKNKNASRVR